MRYDGSDYELRRFYLCVMTVLPMCCDGSDYVFCLKVKYNLTHKDLLENAGSLFESKRGPKPINTKINSVRITPSWAIKLELDWLKKKSGWANLILPLVGQFYIAGDNQRRLYRRTAKQRHHDQNEWTRLGVG